METDCAADPETPPPFEASEESPSVLMRFSFWNHLNFYRVFFFGCQATHPGLLKISGLHEGVYTFQMTVTDSAGQRSSDNVSVTVLAPKHQAEGDALSRQTLC